jgi:hypothetical protein
MICDDVTKLLPDHTGQTATVLNDNDNCNDYDEMIMIIDELHREPGLAICLLRILMSLLWFICNVVERSHYTRETKSN